MMNNYESKFNGNGNGRDSFVSEPSSHRSMGATGTYSSSHSTYYDRDPGSTIESFDNNNVNYYTSMLPNSNSNSEKLTQVPSNYVVHHNRSNEEELDWRERRNLDSTVEYDQKGGNNYHKEHDRRRKRSYMDDEEHDHYNSLSSNSHGRLLPVQPNNVLIIRGVNPKCADSEPIYARMAKEKDSGRNRGFAFVKLNTVEEANKLLDLSAQGRVMIGGEVVRMDYSSMTQMQNDWVCQFCKGYNFEKRVLCFKCGQPKTVEISNPDGSPTNDGSFDISPFASRVILIRQLLPSAKDDVIFASLKNVNPHLNRIFYMQSKHSNAFLGYVFAEYESDQFAQNALDLISSLPSFSLCGRPVLVSFGRDLMLSSDGHWLEEASYWDPNVTFSIFPSPTRVRAPCADEGKDSLASLAPPMAPPLSPPTTSNIPSTSNPYSSVATESAYTPPVMVGIEVISRLIFKDSIGKFEDPLTGSIYSFDPNTNTYSLIKAGSQLEEKNKKLVTPVGQIVNVANDPLDSLKAKPIAPIAPSTQKKIQIQLKKWQNRQQEVSETSLENIVKKSTSTNFVKSSAATSEESSSRTGIKGFSDYVLMACLLCQRQFKCKEDLERHNSQSELHKTNLKKHEEKEKMAASTVEEESISTFIEENSNDPDDDDDNLRYNKKPKPPTTSQSSYRNRAEERRKTTPAVVKSDAFIGYGVTSSGGYSSVEQPTINGIGEDNIGNKMLQKMGWKAGEGLGKSKNGITLPIEPVFQAQGSGLGASAKKNLSHAISGGDKFQNYQQRVWETNRARLEELSKKK